jgi:hypothetical protein
LLITSKRRHGVLRYPTPTMKPLIIAAKRTARIVEPKIKSIWGMLANATHELMFHRTIEEDRSSFKPCGTIPSGVPPENKVTGRAANF